MSSDGEKAAEELKTLTQKIKEAKTSEDRAILFARLQKNPELFPELLKITKEMNFCPPMQMMMQQQEEEKKKKEQL